MAGPLDLGAIRGTIELDTTNFDQKYGNVDRMLSQLASRQVRDVRLGADTVQAEAKFAKVEQLAKQIDGTTATPSVTADAGKAEAAIGGVESLLKSIDGDMAIAKIDADATKAETEVADLEGKLEVLRRMEVTPEVTADITKADKNLAEASFRLRRLDGLRAEMQVDVDAAKAKSEASGVEGMLEDLARREFDPRVGVDIGKAQKSISGIELDLEVLRRMEVTPQVTADITKAEKNLGEAQSRLRALEGLRAEMKVDADVTPAETEIKGLGAEGEAAGDDAGEGMSKGILAGLAAIPIAGGVALIGVAIAKGLLDGIMEGLQQEASRDLFSVRTGLDEATSEKFGRAAGDAYGQAWGDSVEANLDTARLALQGGLIDGDATTAEVEKIISSLTAVSELLGEDIPRLSRAVGVMMKTGMAKDADEALDIITAGMQAGANVSEDLLDTLTEYPAVFAKLGIDGETSVGLISQAMRAGARDTDYAADALKEFQIRATDGSEASAEAFEGLGLNAEKMTAKIAKGGDDASAGLGMVLDGLRAMEDPVLRNQAAVGLFGTKAEDLGDALYAMDTSSAVQELEEVGDVAGRAEAALTTMAYNGASKVEAAKRSIELAGTGIKGALATAFEDPLSALSDYVANNRAGVLEFLGGLADGLFDMGRAGVESVATLLEAFGDFLEFGVVQGILGMADFVRALDGIPGVDLDISGFEESTDTMIAGLRDTRWGAYQTAEELRTSLIDEGLDPLQKRFNEGLDTQILSAQVHDATVQLSNDIGSVGESIENLNGIKLFEDGSFKTTNDDARALDKQLRKAVDSLGAVQTAGVEAGESQGSLTEKWQLGRDALVGQLTAMGFTKGEAQALAEAYGAIPKQIETSASLQTAPALAHLDNLIVTVDKSSGTIKINGNPANGDQTLGKLIGDVNKADGTVTINGNKVPANLTLEQYLGKINASDGTVTVKGDDRPGRYVLKDYKGAINASDGTVDLLGDDAKGRLELRDFVRGINDSDGTTTILGQDRPGRATLFDYQRLINASDGTVDVLGNDKPGQDELRDFLHGVDTSDGTVDVKARTVQARQDMAQFFKDQSGKTIGVTYGFNSAGGRADGGFQENGRLAFAEGGMTETGQSVPRQSMMGGPAYGKRNVMWGEEETGWEAYISGKPGMESRNRDILGIAADRLGMAIAPIEEYANGGLRNVPTTLDVDADMSGVEAALAGLGGGGAGGGSYSDRGGDWQKIVAMIRAVGLSPSIQSTYRPGAITATGRVSRHGLGKAVDMSANLAIEQFLNSRHNEFRELYMPTLDKYWLKGQNRWDFPGAAKTINNHNFAGGNAHIHAAYEDGGIMDALSNPKMADTGQVSLDPGANVVYNGLGRQEHMSEVPAAPTAAPVHVSVYLGDEDFTDKVRVIVDNGIQSNESQRTLALQAGPR